ncbi:MAG: FMN-binding protein [Ruminococcus sp.]|nr:FMN-binding protein [Ruminococcus sp.]
MNKILPSLVLTIICLVASALLVFAHELTKENIAEQKELKFSSSVESLFGKTDSKLVEGDFGDGIEAIAVTPDGRTAVQVIADGYSKDGINILVGIDADGKVSGIEFVSLGETPGLGSKVRDIPEFREQFYGKGSNAQAAAVDGISGATFSSEGMMEAVGQALDAYNENKEAILNGGK